MGKINPKKIPRTEDDVRKARLDGYRFGSEFMFNLFLWVLLNEYSFDRETAKNIWKTVLGYIEDVADERTNYKDIKDALGDEFNITVRITNGNEKKFGVRNG